MPNNPQRSSKTRTDPQALDPSTVEEIQENPKAALQLISQTVRFSGPVPQPDDLARYDEILPGAADRIFAMAEKEQAHRHFKERTTLDISSRGQWFGFILGIVILAVGGWLLHEGRDAAGYAALISALVALVGAFFYSRSEAKKE